MIKIVPFFSPLSTKSIQEEALSQLLIDNNDIITPDIVLSPDSDIDSGIRHYLFVGTGGTENDIVNFIQRAKLSSPIILLSYESNNSLPAALEIRKYLDIQNTNVQIVHGTLKELATIIQDWKQFIKIKNKLKTIRIGVIGVPSDWLIASHVYEKDVEKVWGAKIVYIPISKVISPQYKEDLERIKEAEEVFIKQAIETKIPVQMVKEAGKITERLNQLIQEFQLDSLTIECFSLIQKTEITACYALSTLNDQGIVAGCEGDIPSTFTMLILKLLTCQTPFMGNLIHINQVENSLILAHCTVPRKMVESHSIVSHFESGKSVAIRGHFKTQQDVTILKIWGSDLTQWWVAEGKLTANLNNSSACRTQIEVSLDEPVKPLLENSFANHHILVLGKHKKRIENFLNFTLSC